MGVAVWKKVLGILLVVTVFSSTVEVPVYAEKSIEMESTGIEKEKEGTGVEEARTKSIGIESTTSSVPKKLCNMDKENILPGVEKEIKKKDEKDIVSSTDIEVHKMDEEKNSVADCELHEKDAINNNLLIVSKRKLENTYNAVELMDFGEFQILQYKTKEELKNAKEKFQKLMEKGEIESVEEEETVMATQMQTGEENPVSANVLTLKKRSAKNIVVAVLDTGYDGKVTGYERVIDSAVNYSKTGKKNSVEDDHGHGTKMASIILKHTAENIKVMPVKVLDSQGVGTTVSVYQGIVYALEHQADIINLSVESYEILNSPVICNLLQEAQKKGVMVVMAAGNQGTDITKVMVNKQDNMVVVSAINTDFSKSEYSNYGEGIDFCSYGSVKAYGLNGTEEIVQGTSVATALVSSVIAECKSLNCNYSYQEIYQLLSQSAFDLGMKGEDTYFGKGALGSSTIQGLYETVVCEEAEIFHCNWKDMPDKKLNTIIQGTTEINLRLFLKRLTKEELEEILKRDTDFNKTVKVAGFDKEGKLLYEKEYVYYKHLLEENFTGQSTTTFGSTTGHFFAKYSEDGTVDSKTTKIKVTVNNVQAGVAFDKLPSYELESSDTSVFDISKIQTDCHKDNHGNYYMIYTKLFRKNVPAHYTATSWSDDHTQSDNSDAIRLYKVETVHHTEKHSCEFILAVDTNGTGLTWWGPEQANGIDTKGAYKSLAHHTTVTVNFTKLKEKLYIDPNGGSYTYTTDGEEVTKKKKFLLATKKCEKSTAIKTPVRSGYTFLYWDVLPEENGNGTYNRDTKKYTHCTKGTDGSTVLKAYWKKNPTNTPTPKPTATSTPKPTATSTPKPTATPTPKPTATSTPKPTATPTSKPTATSTPKPTATPTPKPTATPTPKPTATLTPKPTATPTPTPKPTATPTPTPPWKYDMYLLWNEPSDVEAKQIPKIEKKNYTVEDVGKIPTPKITEDAEFAGWCLGKPKWSGSGDNKKLEEIYWLTATGKYEQQKIENDEQIDTESYQGKVFDKEINTQVFLPYITKDQDEIILIGRWYISVSYDVGEGIGTERLKNGQKKVYPDKNIQLLNDIPTLLGTEFMGWIEPQGSIIWKSGAWIGEKGFGKNTILKAQYQYYIQYQKADGTICKDSNGKTEFVKKYGEKISISDVEYPSDGNCKGHHYKTDKRWNVMKDGSERYQYGEAKNYPQKSYKDSYVQGESVLINRNVILKAEEEPNTYTVQYIENTKNASTKQFLDWKGMEKQKIVYGDTVTLRDISTSLLPGYEFAGWNTKADGSGVSFKNKEYNTVEEFLKKAGINANYHQAEIPLYAQWKPKSYTLTFDTNRPTAENNTHASTNDVSFKGTKTMEFVWDSYITNGKIEELDIPIASLKGWHQRFEAGLWYSGKNYKTPGNAIKTGTRLGYEILGVPGNKTVYAQWEANTYQVVYDGNGEEKNGRTNVTGTVSSQTLTYDKPSTLNTNAFCKRDLNYQYHDDEKIVSNKYGTKHNKKASEEFDFYYLGWSREKIGRGAVTLKTELIKPEEAIQEKIWNLTEKDKDKIILYACWDGIPNITTLDEKRHFDRYEGAILSIADMKKTVKSCDLEQKDTLTVKVTNISYYDGEKLIKSIENPKDTESLDTTLPEHLKKDGGYKTYKITFEAEDEHGIRTYAGESSKKEVSYTGKIYYNNIPEIKTYDDKENLYDRYFYLQEVKNSTREEFLKQLLAQIKVKDKEDEEYSSDKDNDLYLGRLYDEPELKVVDGEKIFETIFNQDKYWTKEDKEQGKQIEHVIVYRDIYGKQVSGSAKIHVVDVRHDKILEDNQEKRYVRFISSEYFNMLDKDSVWVVEKEYKEKLEKTLALRENPKEMYELEKGKLIKKE